MPKRLPRMQFVLPTTVDPPRICVQIEIPNDPEHIAAFEGSIRNLGSAYNWQNDSAHTAKDVAQVWRDVFDKFIFRKQRTCPTFPSVGADGGDENMIRQNPDNPCQLQTSIDGTNWCTFADLSLCVPGGNQPGAGAKQPAPGGGEACYHAQMNANDKWVLPTNVSTGDVIDFSNVSGAGNDGGVASWFCPNGKTFFLGDCSGGPGFDGSDPLTSAPHMNLIVNIDGTFYDAFNTTITVPGGVSNAIVYVQINDSGLSNNSGSYTWDVCVHNNAAAIWTHVFDFTANDGGWITNTPVVGTAGHWVGGTGWEYSDFQEPATNYYRGVDLIRDFSARTLTHIKVTFNVHGLFTDTGSASTRFFTAYGGSGVIVKTFADTTEGDSLTAEYSTPTAAISHLRIFHVSSYEGAGASYTGSARVTRIEVSGEGTDPF